MNHYLSRTFGIPARSPNAFSTQSRTAIVTTTFRTVFIFGSIGMSVLTMYRTTPMTTSVTSRPISVMGRTVTGVK